MTTCPAGHATESTDYCDVCGIAITSAAAPVLTPPEPAPADDTNCPHCGSSNPSDALFCEACGYDFTTGTLPRSPADTAPMAPISDPIPPTSAPAGETLAESLPTPWVVEVWIDPDWYTDQGASDPLPSPGLPVVVAVKSSSVLIGRASASRNIAPDIDLSGDSGVSRRHAQLTTDGTRWFIEDLGSSNGTYVASTSSPLPKTPISTGQKRELAADDRIFLGAWTRLVLREAQPGEVS